MTTPPSTTTREPYFPLVPLDEWRNVYSWHPFHFWQLADNRIIPVTSSCSTLVRENAFYSADRSGRFEIRQGMLDAENKIRNYLNYSIAPHYVAETIPFPKFDDRRFDWRGYSGSDGRWKTLRAKEGYIQAVGTEALTAIAQPAVTYSDTDLDGLNETFTVTFPTTVTSTDEIAVYFAAADRLDGAQAEERWRINPVTVSISGGTATVRGRSWLLVKPVKYQGFKSDSAAQLDPTDTSNFVTTLEAYRRYTSAGTSFDTAQAVLIWNTRPYPDWALLCAACPSLSTDPAGEAYALARVGVQNAINGTLTVGESVYDAANDTWSQSLGWGVWCRPPDRVIVRYLAGYPLENGHVASFWREPVCRLAGAELRRPICACADANRAIYEDQFDLSRSAGVNDEQYSYADDTLSNPFGTRRGAVYAWRQVENFRQERGYVA